MLILFIYYYILFIYLKYNVKIIPIFTYFYYLFYTNSLKATTVKKLKYVTRDQNSCL